MGIIVGDEAYVSAISQRGGQLKSLALSNYIAPVPTEIVVDLCRSLTSVEELHLLFRTPAWLTDEVLRTIGTHCQRLRRLSLGCAADYGTPEIYTSQGATALLQDCSLLKDAHIYAIQTLPSEVRALRPDVTFRDRYFEPCSFWRAPENSAETY
jgi:hypothetical protein